VAIRYIFLIYLEFQLAKTLLIDKNNINLNTIYIASCLKDNLDAFNEVFKIISILLTLAISTASNEFFSLSQKS